MALVYTNNSMPEKEIVNTVPKAEKKLKYLGIKLTKYVKEEWLNKEWYL